MRLLLSYGARDLDLQVVPDGTGFVVAVEGQERRVEGTIGGSMRARVDGRPIEAWVRRQGENVIVEMRGHAYTFRLRDPRAPKLARRSAHADLTRGELHAPMPGLIVKVLAEEGDEVEAGRPIVVIEAMKMQNALAAPVSGRVRSITVAPGIAVETGQLLLAIIPEEP